MEVVLFCHAMSPLFDGMSLVCDAYISKCCVYKGQNAISLDKLTNLLYLMNEFQ